MLGAHDVTSIQAEASGQDTAAAGIEAVEFKQEKMEDSGNASSTATSSDGETTTLLQQAHRLQRKMKPDQEETLVIPPELRRSSRKRRTVEVLSPSQVTSSTAAAARAEAAVKEKRRKLAAKRKKNATGNDKTPKGVLSPVQDEKKKTPTKKRSSKARRSLEPTYSYECETQFVSNLITELYEEQEQDDRGMYSITKETVVSETSSCNRSQEVTDLSMEDFRRLMTYGEVTVESFATRVLPMLNLDADDVFFDLGCGTGKILVQTALQTPCKRAIGIELMQNRVQEGHKALNRLKEREISILHDKQIEIFRGDIFVPPEEARLMDATVVFINNVMFGPQLMLKVLQLLSEMPKLRCVITLRKICERHGNEKCSRAGNYCVSYVQPPIEEEIDVSWADKTSVYFYECLDYKIKEMTRALAKRDYQPTVATAE
ncbi:Histone methyltransferase [Phytophthora palmivora]|uniref:Histone-lysine N-methyltransferase, H3 lysine-79 specific n=1 Tax=Phytophthora palmivora TaxID=4796 RepID=A0A2P4XUN7_9STRA|nr:Histone methyltransferase [Phytophthora palmivora]